MKPEGPAQKFSICRLSDNGISRGGANTFSEPVHESGAEHCLPSDRERYEKPAQRRDGVASGHQPFAVADPVRKPSRKYLE
jgi:hypothetical protein